MDIAIHIGAHATDDDRLLKGILKNREALRDQRIAVPPPSQYRILLRETLNAMGPDGEPAEGARDALLDDILGEDEGAHRLVMSNQSFVCIPNRVFEHGKLYHLADARVAGMARLFPDDALEFHMGMRNPATFIPEIYHQIGKEQRERMLAQLDPFEVRWSEMIARMRMAAPEARIVVWCNEDSPFIWSTLIRTLSGVDARSNIYGGFDLLTEIMTREGLQRFQAYLQSHPPKNETQKRRVIAAFLDKFAIEDALEDEIDMPGWTEETVEHLTDLYDDDVDEIAEMEGVDFVAP
ncbi:MAG: hypothetical protein ACU0CO_17300 [Shimia sp.]